MIARGEFLHGITGVGATLAAVDLPNYTAQVAIGVVAPFSGESRKAGEALGNGVRAAIDDANRVRGGLDRVFTMRTFDDHGAIADAIVNAQFATSDPTIIAVVGHLGVKTTLAAARIYADALMPLVVPASTDDALTQTGYRTIYRLPTRDFDEGQLLARFIAEQNKPKNAHVLVQDGDYGTGVANGFTAAMNAKKIPTATTVFAYAKPDFAAVAIKVLGAQPDHITLAGVAADMAPVMRALRDRGYTGPFAASQGFFEGLVTTQYAKDAEGMTISTSMPPLALAPAAFRIRNDFESRYGGLVPISAFAYAATQIIANAVRRSGANGRTQLARALATGGNFDTLVGSFTFGASGDAIDPNLYFYTVRDGKFAYVRQAHPSGFLSR
ncbi:MAG: branched-chain amino acid ABC transporter substrate-binding protein [Candidatus Velthaea sp.]